MTSNRTKSWSTRFLGKFMLRELNFLLGQLNLLIQWILLAIILIFCVPNIYAQEIDCDNSVYLSTHISTGSSLYRFQADNGISNIEEIFANNTSYRIACMGYSVADKMIYALEYNSLQLLRINAFGEIIPLGVPNGLDTTLTYYAGGIFPTGRDFLVIGKKEAEQEDHLFFAIDVFDFRATPLSIISDGAVSIQDMSKDPLNGVLYGFDNKQGKLVDINNGQVSNFQFSSISERFTALFSDKNGQLYGFGEEGAGSSRKFFSINKITGEATYLQQGPMGNDTDACTCPYAFQFFKKITPQEVIPCGEVTIEYTFLNTSGSARTNLRILDELPEGLTITEIVENTNAFNTRIKSGVGTNILDLTRMEALLGNKSKIIIKAVVNPNASGRLTSQAILENLPLALNPKMLSDNIETDALADANFIEIINEEITDFEDIIAYACNNETAIITAPLNNAQSFRWSDGSNESKLTVDQAGVYWVEMATDCKNYIDTIVVDFDTDIPFIDLGPDQIQNQGAPFTLSLETNISDIQQYAWTASPNVMLSCTDCPSPTLQLLQSTTLTLSVIDENGCIAADAIFIEVNTNKQIYAPTAFSPNGDGINDFFYLQGNVGTIEVLRIFDRWGNQVFENKNAPLDNPSYAWEGKYNNRLLENGVFIWYAHIKYPDGTSDTMTGTVSLIK